MYTAYMQFLEDKRRNKNNDFRNTTQMNNSEAAYNARMAAETQERIKRLEEEEMQMLQTMQ